MMENLLLFEYESELEVRTVQIKGEIWWIAQDICDILSMESVEKVCAQLDPDEFRPFILNGNSVVIVNEPGLYSIVLRSDNPEAKKFKKWITTEVIPKIRKTGTYSIHDSVLPAFVRRFNENWDRIESGYFSVISEMIIRVYGRLEQIGYILPDKGKGGREIRPDVSVGKLFSSWMQAYYPDHANNFKMYKHKFPGGIEVDARQYQGYLQHIFIYYVDNIWMVERAKEYFLERDPNALSYLPRLLPKGQVPALPILT